jgi:hypothetical protein
MVIRMRRLLYALVALVLGATAAVLAAPATASASSHSAAAAAEICPGFTAAYPFSPNATIMSSTTTPFVGQKIEASGIKYCPNENVRLTIGGQFVGNAHTNGAGSFDPPVIVPGPPGDKLLCGVGASGLLHDQDCLTLHVVAPTGPNSSPPLSFTGVEIGAIVAVALALLIGGVLFATAGRRRKSA